MPRILLIAAALTLVCAASALAQDEPTLAPGARVRVTYTDLPAGGPYLKTAVGTLVELGDDAIVLRRDEDDPPWTLPRADLRGLELSLERGNRGRSVLRGMAYAGLFGALWGLASGDDDEGFLSLTAEQKATVLAAVMLPVGALIGLAVSHGERWEPMATDELRLALGVLPDPAGPAPGLCVVLRF